MSFLYLPFQGTERPSVRTVLWWVFITVGLPSVLAAAYYFTNPKMSAKASTVQAGGAALALLIVLVQTAAQPKRDGAFWEHARRVCDQISSKNEETRYT